MTVTIAINGTTLVPQPQTTRWEPVEVGGKLDGTQATGAYYRHILTSPPFAGTANFNWDTFDNTTLTSITTHAPGDTMTGGTVTYSAGVVSKTLKFTSPPGGIVQSVDLEILVVI